MKKTMKKSIVAALALVLLVGVAIVLPLSSAHAVETFAVETELRQYNPAKSYGGYFLYAIGDTMTALLDMEGNVVHQWTGSIAIPKLLEDGNLLSLELINNPGGRNRCQLMDWDGNILWSFDPKTDPTPVRTEIVLHHDEGRIWNKKLKAYTYLIGFNIATNNAEIWAAGGDPSVNYGNVDRMDGIIEVNQNKQIVWEWRFLDHAVQSKNPAWPNYVSDVKLAPGKCDLFWKTNQAEPSQPAGVITDWHHVNSIDYNEDLDQVVVNAKHFSEFYVIDHGKTFVSTTDWAANRAAAKGLAGDFIYRFGNPSAYKQGTAPGFQNGGDQQMYGSHNIQWIKPYHWARPHAEAGDKWPDPVGYTASGIALPGAGNFLIFDNGCYNPTGYRSKILEINPYLNAAVVNTGAFVNPPDAGYTTVAGGGGVGGRKISKQVVWSYQSIWANSFYSQHISSAQRLPNGNTSITSGTQGHKFEVTPTGEVVWEYITPTVSGGFLTVRRDEDKTPFNIYRHYRYGKDFPGLAGKDLTPMGTITGRIPSVIGSDFKYPAPVTYYGFGFGAGGATVGGGGGVGAGTGGGAGGY